ncbi:MAG: inositol monophosphatase [Rhodospirillales bacterium]|nr:inositol monophosphatase [Rhodospirillales bacterium]
MAQESALLNVMTGAARKAARGLVRDFGEVENLQVSRKGPADFVSAADHKAERIVCAELRKARPRYGILSEESGLTEGADTSNRWIVDPLDGTTNFLHGLAHFAISIGLERDAELIAGVIYAPVLDQLFVAEKGQGARLNGNRLRVSARKQMGDALFATGIPFMGVGDHERVLQEVGAVMAVSAGVRRFGTASLDLAYVAAGRFEGFWETGLYPWDMAAGIVLVREAGGYVSEIGGGTEMMKNRNILAANDSLHQPLGRILRSVATQKPQ